MLKKEQDKFRDYKLYNIICKYNNYVAHSGLVRSSAKGKDINGQCVR